MDLRDVLADAYVFAAQPVVAAGDPVGRTVRWVHASEQLDIAPLLRGGELILSEAANLRSASRDAQTAYLDSLAEAGVAALALETTDAFPRIPAAFLAHAEERGFPIIELRRRVPFVQICESINSQLADSSLRRLQIADRMSMALSESVQELVGIDALLTVLSEQTRSSVTLTSLSGELLGSAGDATPPPSATSTFSAPVSFGGTVVATLTLHPADDADIRLLSAALERAPEILAIALVHSRPISAEDRAKSRFFSLLSAPAASARPGAHAAEQELAAVAQQLGFGATDLYLSLVATVEHTHVAALHETLSSSAPHVITQLSGSELAAVLGFASSADLETRRAELIERLNGLATARPGFVVCVGNGSRHIGGVAHCLASARDTLRFTGTGASVLDARHFALARLWRELDDDEAATRYIDEQIGTLLRRDAEAPGELFETLAAYVTHWGSKTDAARDLNIQRQTFYQRLEKIFTLIGPLPAGSPRIPAILTAVFLEQGRRQSGASIH
ncbi:purine catabolism regulator [Okibacterium sp. HSC-33S16]|uniref:PucR family transcriptional regulator n=1 Tax=Okibacterium sp. HSC-33S16 TaxID=2910965 RepID=UPI00209DD66D|nr:PucR family transcriptional regulator [Okibacterium sp. HSC-33S16]MCP2032139.1 purine catabolism regulator [Okibacterium sp. HSC-33S16]